MNDKDHDHWNPEFTEAEEAQIAALMDEGRRSLAVMRGLREHLGVTQAEFARLLGVTQSNVSKMEAGAEPRWSALRKLVEHRGGRLKMVVEVDGRTMEWPLTGRG